MSDKPQPSKYANFTFGECRAEFTRLKLVSDNALLDMKLIADRVEQIAEETINVRR